MLSPLQVLMINKRMPKGYKLELEENLLKYLDTIKPAPKKTKVNVCLYFNLYKSLILTNLFLFKYFFNLNFEL